MKPMKSALAWVASGSLVLLSAGDAAAQTISPGSTDSTASLPVQLPVVGAAQAQVPTPAPASGAAALAAGGA